ncbi:hypothetical protein LEP1GSC062_0715 [Leptospira alexanderi serovar Manhao 3 str. L 60]|uniref:Uncharacterized protein n=1 Tax=Leptospira alexanderi serovar Manhao 3 str. L 60 TaxID=1049759 RepID=V6IFW7_9LEPT|nr:hypothetical protein LEP1GSC062_0715 [Leptospira alexanderi serovar Manhao 3 str. L 60]
MSSNVIFWEIILNDNRLNHPFSKHNRADLYTNEQRLCEKILRAKSKNLIVVSRKRSDQPALKISLPFEPI